jgi:predicted AAA+ superfamily ATPase
MYIPQIELKHLKSVVAPGKVIVIYGPRRVGKTTLLKKYLETEEDYLFVTGGRISLYVIFSQAILSTN